MQGTALCDQKFLTKSWWIFRLVCNGFCRARPILNQKFLIRPCRTFPSVNLLVCRAQPFYNQIILDRLRPILSQAPSFHCTVDSFSFSWLRIHQYNRLSVSTLRHLDSLLAGRVALFPEVSQKTAPKFCLERFLLFLVSSLYLRASFFCTPLAYSAAMNETLVYMMGQFTRVISRSVAIPLYYAFSSYMIVL